MADEYKSRISESWKEDRLARIGVDIKGYTRSEFIRKVNRIGYNNINSHDVSWATSIKLITPRILAENLHIYEEDDVRWMLALSVCKKEGLDKSSIEKMLAPGLIDYIIRITERIKSNKSGE